MTRLITATLGLIGLVACLTSPADYAVLEAMVTDADGDGFLGRDDCNDADATIHPDAAEVWYDGVDQDCDGNDDDQDLDGVGLAEDCDDEDPLSFPGGEETCNGVDEDCDGDIDEGMAEVWYPDEDGDGYGDDAAPVTSCLAPSGHVDRGGDCDDSDPATWPGAVEVCGDGVVNGCGTYDASCRAEGKVSLGEVGEVVASELVGNDHEELVGAEVSLAGDANGDGVADLLLGGAGYGGSPSPIGVAWLVYGPPGAEVDLLRDADARFEGEDPDDRAGKALAFVGDLDRDGDDDLVVAGWGVGSGAGLVYVVTDKPSGRSPLSHAHATLVADHTFTEMAVAGIGDLDGDQRDDFAVGDVRADAYTGVVHLWSLPDSGDHALGEGFATLVGDDTGEQAGLSVSERCDVNGDGVHDLVVGAPRALGDDGMVYLVLGPVSGQRALADADARLLGSRAGGQAGFDVAASGDLSGDGLDDVVVGAPEARDNGVEGGVVYVLRGAPAGDMDLEDATAILVGDQDGARLGHAVALRSDLDADGRADLVVGAERADQEATDDGGVFVFYDAPQGTVSLDGAQLTLHGAAGGNGAGSALAGGGDANGDGFDDLLVGASRYGGQSTRPGAAYLVLGAGP